MKRYKAVIFDLDGTMIDTEKMNLVPLKRLLKSEKGMDVQYEKLRELFGLSGEDILRRLGLQEDEVKDFYVKWVRGVDEFGEKARLYDGFKHVIPELCRKGIACGVASSKNRKQYAIDMGDTGLDKYMQCVVLENDTALHKPNPDPLLKAAELLKINPKDMLYIGDAASDAISSERAGMDFGLALWSGAHKEGINYRYAFNMPCDILSIF